MAIYGITERGTDTYGFSLPPTYVAPGFAAHPVNYGTIRVTWNAPSAQVYGYRLLTNRYGYPVNENDGNIVLASTTFPGGTYNDNQVIPGSYHYYGLYVLNAAVSGTWVRAGVAACLAPFNFASDKWMLSKLPEHFTQLPNGGELTGDSSGNSYLAQFLGILGWGFDYVQTQYAMLAQHLNDPYEIPLNDLLNMASEVGLVYSPSTPARTIRKGVANQAHVSRQRGTFLGLANEIVIRTGWGADVQLGRNMLLATDESAFLSPVFDAWTSQRYYVIGECVWTGTVSASRVWTGSGYWYQALLNSQNVQPPGDGTSNSYWECLSYLPNFLQTLTSSRTSLPVNWEALDLASGNGYTPSGTLSQVLGVPNILSTGNAWNALALDNLAGSTQTFLVRSVSRATSDLNLIPDGGFEAGFTAIATGVRPDPTWIPASWPKLYRFVPPHAGVSLPDYFGQKGQQPGMYLIPAFWTGVNCWIVRTGTSPNTGSWCGEIIPQNTSSGTVTAGSPWFSVTAGDAVTITSEQRYAPTASSFSSTSQIDWFDSHGSPVAGIPSSTPVVTALTSSYAAVSCSGTAPAGAFYGCLSVAIPSTQKALIDDVTAAVTASLSSTNAPDQADVIANAIPVPWADSSKLWDPAKRYATGSLVQYRGLPFKALRASTGVIPPLNDVASTEWTPLSEHARIRLAVSAYVSGATAIPATPFVEWYDQHGNFISRVFGQTAAADGTVAKPASLYYDSFIEQSRLTSTGGSGSVTLSNWEASFWANQTMAGAPAYTTLHTVVNPAVPQIWAGTQPAPSIGNSGWSAKWVATFTPEVSGTYLFQMYALSTGSPVVSVGSRLIVNGEILLNNWTASFDGSAFVELAAGTLTTVEVDYKVPGQPPGAWTANLTPGTWTPPSANANWTSAFFPVIGSYNYKASASMNAGSGSFFTHAGVTAQVIWFDAAGVIISTSQATKTGSSGTLTASFNGVAPAEAVNAQFYVSVQGYVSTFTMSFAQQLSTLATTELLLPATNTFVASGPQYSNFLAGRYEDTSQENWGANVGAFNVLAGHAWPVTLNTRSYSLMSGPANTMLGVTLRTLPSGALAQGLIFRFSSDTSYWRCDQAGIRRVSGSTWTTGATHSAAFTAGDRMTLELNGNVITCFRNGVQVSTVTSSYNATMASHGILSNDVLES
jgi:hypothetical protein